MNQIILAWVGLFTQNRTYILASKVKHQSMAMSGTDWLEVPTICKAEKKGLNFREYPHNSYGQTYGTVQYLHFRILKFPLTIFSYNLVYKHH